MKNRMLNIVALVVQLTVISAWAGSENKYDNPIITADYSDPDVIRVDDDYYMTSSSFNIVPGLPVLHSKDLVHWTLIGHGVQKLPKALFTYKRRKSSELDYDQPRLGKGIFAPSIRHHDGLFWIVWADPDAGIYQVTAKNPAGPWTKPVLMHKARGIIDPCPIWDAKTGKAYLSFAYARSRSGINSRIDVWEMEPDGTRLLGNPVTVYDAKDPNKFPADRKHDTIEGTKMMQRGEWFYILCPAGGVSHGWQTAMRSKHPLGPYKIRTVCESGKTGINGPHQGGLVDTPAGEWWFIHFHAVGTLGRIVRLEPAKWKDGWPVIGIDPDGDGIGNPVHSYKAPLPFVPKSIQMSDDFSSEALGLQWQWPANPQPEWAHVSDGKLRLPAQFVADKALAQTPSVLTQMFPAFKFSATASVALKTKDNGVRAGLASMGKKTFDIGIEKTEDGFAVSVRHQNNKKASARLPDSKCWLRLTATGKNPLPLKIRNNGKITGQFSYSADGLTFVDLGKPFTVSPGAWIGARVGLFCLKTDSSAEGAGYVDTFDIAIPK